MTPALTATETAEMHDAQPQLQLLQRPASAPTAAEAAVAQSVQPVPSLGGPTLVTRCVQPVPTPPGPTLVTPNEPSAEVTSAQDHVMHDAQPASAPTPAETAETHDAQPQLQRLQSIFRALQSVAGVQPVPSPAGPTLVTPPAAQSTAAPAQRPAAALPEAAGKSGQAASLMHTCHYRKKPRMSLVNAASGHAMLIASPDSHLQAPCPAHSQLTGVVQPARGAGGP